MSITGFSMIGRTLRASAVFGLAGVAGSLYFSPTTLFWVADAVALICSIVFVIFCVVARKRLMWLLRDKETRGGQQFEDAFFAFMLLLLALSSSTGTIFALYSKQPFAIISNAVLAIIFFGCFALYTTIVLGWRKVHQF